MFDIGWSELLVIAVVMIVVVGPKDLPKMLRAFGKATGKLRATASEFRAQFDEALREAELDDVKTTIDSVKKYDPRKTVTDLFEPVRTAGNDLRSSLSDSVSKPGASPAVSPAEPIAGPMDSPLDLSETKEDAANPVAVSAKPVVKARVKKSAATAPEAKTATKTAKPKAAADKAVAVKKTAPTKAAATSAKPAAKVTRKTGIDQ